MGPLSRPESYFSQNKNKSTPALDSAAPCGMLIMDGQRTSAWSKGVYYTMSMPTEPGWYWLRDEMLGWLVAAVFYVGTDEWLGFCASAPGIQRDGRTTDEHLEWGPRISEPPALAAMRELSMIDPYQCTDWCIVCGESCDDTHATDCPWLLAQEPADE